MFSDYAYRTELYMMFSDYAYRTELIGYADDFAMIVSDKDVPTQIRNMEGSAPR